jgi:deoxyadenosine/deoxycytidine kinase
MWSSMIPFKPSLYVYLDTNIDDAINRLEERARSGEIVSNKYQMQLQKQHHNFYNNVLEKRYNYNNLVIGEDLMASDYRNDYKHNNINVIREMIFSKLNSI